MAMTATHIDELAVVELLHDRDGFPQGTVGAVVVAHPEFDLYTVEITDAKGRTVGLVDAHSEELVIEQGETRPLDDCWSRRGLMSQGSSTD